MATVTGLTAARMKEIEEQSIVDARIDENDNLVFTTYGETEINVGSFRGEKGDPGPGGSITKVNGKTGSEVTLTAADVGAASSDDLAGLLPVGTILATARTTAPAGFLLCNGAAVARTGTYAALYAQLSTRFGAGNGTSTFNLPDLRARTPVGQHASYTEFDTIGETGGSRTQTLAVANMPSHDHGLNSTDVGATVTNSLSRASGTTDNGGNSLAAGDNSGRFDKKVQIRGTTNSTGGGAAFSILNPYQVVNYMIKY